MKRMIVAKEMPGGYLETNRFNSRINDNNVLEAVELAISQKFDQWEKTMDRQFYLTSGTGWTGEVTEYPEGYYIMIDVTRGGFQAFVSGDTVIRKPRKLGEPIAKYSIDGDKGHVYYVSTPKYLNSPKKKEAKLGEWEERFDATTDQTAYILNTEDGRATVQSFYEGDFDDPVAGYAAKVYRNGASRPVAEYFYNDEYMALARAKAWAEDELMGYHDEDVESATDIKASEYNEQFHQDNDYFAHTRRDEVKFDHDVVWSVQFYNNLSDLIYADEMHILARTYDEALRKGRKLAQDNGYNPNQVVVQYAYKLPESVNISAADEVDDAWEAYDPYKGKKYRVDQGNNNYVVTNDPGMAIELWFRGSKKHPSDCAIMTKTKQDGINLLAVAEDIVRDLYEEYGNPYKLEYLESMIRKKLGDGLEWFHEGEYGDQVDPFSYG